MKHSKKLYSFKNKAVQKLNAFHMSYYIRVLHYKKFIFNLGWKSCNNVIFIQFVQLCMLIRKGLRFHILYKNISKSLQQLNFILSLARLYPLFLMKNKKLYLTKMTFQKLVQQLNTRIRKIFNQNFTLDVDPKVILYKRWLIFVSPQFKK